MEPNTPKEITFVENSVVSPKRSERNSWQGMFQNLYKDVSRLLKKEGQLIKAELTEKSTEVKTASTSLVAGGLILLTGLFCAAASGIIILNIFMQLWAASLIVTLALLLAGGIMLSNSMSKLKADKLKLTKSMNAIGEISNTLKEKAHEITRH